MAQREDRAVLVRLSGEFDVRYQRILEDTLSDCLASGSKTYVDLSGVTFMDSRCVRELAIHYQLGEGRVTLCDPSWETELSVAVCDLEEWMDFVYTGPPPAFHEAEMRQEKGTCPCAHHTRRQAIRSRAPRSGAPTDTRGTRFATHGDRR